MTPEGKVKKAVQKALAAHNIHSFTDIAAERVAGYAGFYYMPVAGPFSVHGVHDFVGCYQGMFFSIETKAPEATEDATVHQERFQRAVNGAGGLSYTGVRDDSVVTQLINDYKSWLTHIRA